MEQILKLLEVGVRGWVVVVGEVKRIEDLKKSEEG